MPPYQPPLFLAGQAGKIFRQAVQYVFGAFAVFGKEPIFAIWIVNTEFPAFVAEIHPRFICNQIGAKGGGQAAETDNPPQQARGVGRFAAALGTGANRRP